jgi:hypothetical protein
MLAQQPVTRDIVMIMNLNDPVRTNQSVNKLGGCN